jgi:hypothetical protein
METRLETMTCPYCDGDGSLSQQWAKVAAVKCGGKRMLLPPRSGGYYASINDGGRKVPMGPIPPAIYYVNAEGKEMEMKTVGGNCTCCGGTGRVPASSLMEDIP